MCYLVFYSFLCWFHFPPLMFLSFCLLDVICCEGHCVLLENRWHSFSWSYLFIFISWFSFWQMVSLVWCTVEFLKFILDTVYNFSVNFFGVLVERVIYDFSEMFSAPQVFNCIPVTRSMVYCAGSMWTNRNLGMAGHTEQHPPPTGDFGISVGQISAITRDHDHNALEALGGVSLPLSLFSVAFYYSYLRFIFLFYIYTR